MTMDRLSKFVPPIFSIIFLLGFAPQNGYAEFLMNFQPGPTPSAPIAGTFSVSCNRGGDINCFHGDPNLRVNGILVNRDPEKTPFLYEPVTDGTSNYWHMIVGDPTKGFAQETFIRIGACCVFNFVLSSSSGDTANGGGAGLNTNTNGMGPLSSSAGGTSGSGSGTGNPERVQIRQITGIQSSDFYQEFLKNTFLNKPKITQDIVSADMSSRFELDMSNIAYRGAAATTTAPAKFVNTVNIVNPLVPGGFDAAAQAQNPQVSAGRYTWTPGTSYGLSGGTYTYAGGGGYSLNDVDWKAYYNPAQNTCWSYKQNPGGVPCTP